MQPKTGVGQGVAPIELVPGAMTQGENPTAGVTAEPGAAEGLVPLGRFPTPFPPVQKLTCSTDLSLRDFSSHWFPLLRSKEGV